MMMMMMMMMIALGPCMHGRALMLDYLTICTYDGANVICYNLAGPLNKLHANLLGHRPACIAGLYYNGRLSSLLHEWHGYNIMLISCPLLALHCYKIMLNYQVRCPGEGGYSLIRA